MTTSVPRCLVLVALLTGASTGRAASPAPGTPPNIVFIVSDDHSFPHVGAYGFPVRTPRLDQFAAEGALFTAMFTTAPQCAPSRASFATGRSSVAVRASRFSSPVPREELMFPELLRSDAHYFTGICRRAHHLDGWTDPQNQISPAIWAKYAMQTVPDRFDVVDMGGRRESTPTKVAAFLDAVPAGRPFFLWVNFNDPHHPWNAPSRHDPATLPMPADWPDLPGLRSDFARYLDEVSRMDEEFGWVLDELDRRHLAPSTLVVFVGDNGLALPRGKGALHDHGLHVPLLVRWPGVVRSGQTIDALISGEDFAPTFLRAAGLTPPAKMSGHDFTPLLRGDAAYVPRTVVFAMRGVHGASIFDAHTLASGFDLSRAVRSADYKLILNYTPFMPYAPVDSRGDPGWTEIEQAQAEGRLPDTFAPLWFSLPRPLVELYDLRADPAELHNLAGQPAAAKIEYQLKLDLQEKMIADFDYLPLPLRE